MSRRSTGRCGRGWARIVEELALDTTSLALPPGWAEPVGPRRFLVLDGTGLRLQAPGGWFRDSLHALHGDDPRRRLCDRLVDLARANVTSEVCARALRNVR